MRNIEFKKNQKDFCVEWDTYFLKNSVILDRILVGNVYLYLVEANILIRGREAEWAYGYTVSYEIGKVKLWAYRGRGEYQIGEKMYMPERINPEVILYKNENGEQELQSVISQNEKSVENFISQNENLLEEYVEKYKEDLKEIEKEKLEEEERYRKEREEEARRKEEDSHESIGDYNSRMGSSSTWFGDAGWMDE